MPEVTEAPKYFTTVLGPFQLSFVIGLALAIFIFVYFNSVHPFSLTSTTTSAGVNLYAAMTFFMGFTLAIAIFGILMTIEGKSN